MNKLRQIGAVLSINLGTIPQQWGSSLVVVVGIAGVIGVLLSVLALGENFGHTFAATGKADRAVITSKGAFSEGSSSLSRNAVAAVLDAPGIKRNSANKPILSTEMLTQLRVTSLGNGAIKNVSLRGIGPLGMALRPELHLISGRMFRAGLHELIVGSALQTQFANMAVGDHLIIQNSPWTIVGVFSANGGGAFDSEILGDADTLLSAFHRDIFQSVTVLLDGHNGLRDLTSALSSNPSLSVEVHREDAFYAAQSKGIVRLLTAMGIFIGGIMATGAIFAAINTMYAAVSRQSISIATLRAIGFDAQAVLTAIFIETLLLAIAGALAGIFLASVLFDGHTLNMRSINGQVVFTLHISPYLTILGIVWALVIGFLGGLLPAIRAARLPVAKVLRAA